MEDNIKVPLRFQNTEYDCGTTSFVNALAYLYDGEDIPVELLKAIYRYTLDVENEEGIKGKGETSREHAEKLSKYFQNYANNKTFDLKCTTLKGKDVDILKIKQVTDHGGVAVARCFLLGDEYYVLITKVDEYFACIFDPYYLEEEAFVKDSEISIVLNQCFTHNRLVTLPRLMSTERKNFSLLNLNDRQVILLEK